MHISGRIAAVGLAFAMAWALLTTIAAAADRPSTQATTSLSAVGAELTNYADRASPLVTQPPTNDEVSALDSIEPGGSNNAAKATSTATTTQPATAPTTEETEEKKGEWLIAPLPDYKPEFGFGILARVGYIFPLDPKDKVSPPSMVGGFGYYAQNGSWAGGLFSKFFIDEDRYRVTAGLFHAEINYDFSGVGTAAGTSGQSVPLSQQMTGGLLEPLFRIAPNFYLGPKYMGAAMHVRIDVDPATSPVKIPTNAIDTTYSALGFHAQWDTRDSQFYPRKGHVADFEVAFHDPAIGDDFAYQVFKASYNGYISLATNQVLAFRLMGQFENGDVPFYALCQFGRGSDLRGYDVGQFQDKQMLAGQLEYRLMITKRFGAVAFGGVGEVAPSLSSLSWDNLLPSGGAGLRYVLAEKNHVALRFDVAWGKTDGPKFYLAVGEAF
jgi:hypothetical protein